MSTFYTGRAAPSGAALPSHFLGQQDADNRPRKTGPETVLGRPENSKDALMDALRECTAASSRAKRARTCW